MGENLCGFPVPILQKTEMTCDGWESKLLVNHLKALTVSLFSKMAVTSQSGHQH